MGAVIGLARALFGSPKKGVVSRAVEAVQNEPDASARGRTADKPQDIPAKGWKDIFWRVYEEIQDDRVLLVSAGIAFYGLLALFPATAAIVSLYGLFADAGTIGQQLNLLAGFLPDGALQIVGDQVTRIVSHGQGTLGLTFAVALVISVWGANAGTKSMFDGLNIVYDEREKRSFLWLNLQSLAFTAATVLLVLLALSAIVAVPVALQFLGIPEGSGTSLLTLLRWPLLYVVILVALACLYRFGPSRAHPQWRWVTWGSAVAGGLWLLGSLAFSWYVASFGSYNATYGSLGAAIGFMTWLWLSTILVLLGAEINAEMEHQTARDTTGSGGKPLGSRGAHMADTVGPARAR